MTLASTLRLSLPLLATLSAGLLSACGGGSSGGGPNDQPVTFDTARSTLARDTAPNVPAADLSELVAGNTAFGFDLYAQLRSQDGNLFMSPYSISSALAMVYAGAKGGTEQEIASTLHYSLPQAKLHPAFDALDLALASRGADADPGSFRLRVANAAWAQKGYSFLPVYLDTLAVSYGAGINLLDFAGDLEASRTTINRWVSQQTEGKIPELFEPGTLDANTKLALTNAIYFKADWDQPFDPDLTSDGAFHTLDGSTVTVPLMTHESHGQLEPVAFADEPDWKAVALPYEGQQLSMVIIVPAEGTFSSFESGFDAPKLAQVLGTLQPGGATVVLPKFHFDSSFDLADTLAAMGMPSAFGDGADFSGMTGAKDLEIQTVVHKAFVAVDEKGTEAAAATGVGMRDAAAMVPTIDVTRPFLFAIRDVATGTVLFLGRVVDPSK